MIYVKKIINQDIEKEIAFPKEPANAFFDFDCMNPDEPYHYFDFIFKTESEKFKSLNETKIENVRMRQHWQKSESKITAELAAFLKTKLSVTEGDLIVFTTLRATDKDKETGKTRYSFDLIKKEQTDLYSKYDFFMKDNHVVFNNDEISEEEKKMSETKPFENFEYKVIDNNTEKKFNRIIFGAPGTGKSHQINLAKNGLPAMAEFERVTFHPNYSYAQFVGTYKPVTKDGGDIAYKYVEGPFMRLLTAALENAKDSNKENRKRYLLIIEEINRANVAAVFGDMFQLLDRDTNGVSDYEIQTSEDVRKYLASKLGGDGTEDKYKTLKLPNNFYIWATMNSADQGVQPMDAAFKRRWNFEYLNIDSGRFSTKIPIPNGTIVTDGKTEITSWVEVEWDNLRTSINDTLKKIPGVNEDKLLGPFFIGNKAKIEQLKQDQEEFNELFKSKILMYLFEDVVKMNPSDLFNKKEGENVHYSDICKEYDEKGLKIFVKSISDKFDEFKAGDNK